MGRLEEDGKTEGESVFVKNTSTCQVFSHSANSDLLDNVSNMSKNSAASIVFLILEREREAGLSGFINSVHRDVLSSFFQ